MEDEQTLLTFHWPKQLWEGEDSKSHLRIWMDAPTFERHVRGYLATTYRIYQPTVGDLVRAREHCRKLSYWQGCSDPTVHFITLDTRDNKKGRQR
jgi:hypothetical protein